MRLVILSDDYLPHSTRIHARMLHELALDLKTRGNEVVVITPGEKKQCSPLEKSSLDGIEIWKFRTSPTRGVSKIRRAINESMLSFNAISALRNAKLSLKFDLCITYSPSIFFGLLTYWLKKRGARTYLVLRDFFPQWVIDQGMISKSSLITKYFRLFEAINYRVADFIGVQSPANIDAFFDMTPYKHQSVEVLYNWASGNYVVDDKEYGKTLLQKENLTKKVVMFYGGNIGHAQDMDNLMRLARGLKRNKEAHILLVGQGDEFDLVERRISEWSLTNVTILHSVSQDQYASILSCVDIGLFSLSASHTTHNFPGKLLGYMSVGIPILGSVNDGNDIIELINGSGAGHVSVNGDDNQLLENAFSLLQDSNHRYEMGQLSADLLSETFSVSKAADQILASISSEVMER